MQHYHSSAISAHIVAATSDVPPFVVVSAPVEEEPIAKVVSPSVEDLESKRALVRALLKSEADLETAKHRLNNDRAYIKLLHDYNYLKVSRPHLMTDEIGCGIRACRDGCQHC